MALAAHLGVPVHRLQTNTLLLPTLVQIFQKEFKNKQKRESRCDTQSGCPEMQMWPKYWLVPINRQNSRTREQIYVVEAKGGCGSVDVYSDALWASSLKPRTTSVTLDGIQVAMRRNYHLF